ncbi:MAG: hypothetical protein GX224_05330 [Thermoplasmatales archaeon]|nr:hypothetical protein [Thermoplasmatales archaeon]
MDSKVIAILAAVLLVAGGASALIVMSKDGGEEKMVDMGYGLLEVYGNANGDHTIDGKDILLLNEIISGAKSKEDYPLADANQDGDIDQKDVNLVNDIINKKEGTVIYVNSHLNGVNVVTVKYPVNRGMATSGTNLLMLVKALDVEDKILAVNKGASSTFGDLFPEYNGKSDLGNNARTVSTEKAKEYFKQGATVLITQDSTAYVKTESDLKAAGIDVVRVKAAAVKPIDWAQAVNMVGFLLDGTERAKSMTNWYAKLERDLSEKIKDVEKPNAVASSTKDKISRITSDYAEAVILAGSDYSIGDYGGTGATIDYGTWLLNNEHDYLFAFKNMGYGEVNEAKEYNERTTNYVDLDVYTNGNCYVINGDVPVPVRVAYLAGIMHKDILGEDFGDNANKDFMKKFYDGKLNFEDGTYVLSKPVS